MKKGVTNEDKFKQVEKLFRSAVSLFMRRYRHAMFRVYMDDMMSAAGEGFVDACVTYDPKQKMKFGSWVWKKVWGKMLDDLRKAFRRSRRSFARVYDLAEEQEAVEFDRDELLAKLSSDGQLAVNLVLDSPMELEFLKAIIGDDTPANTREAVRQYLLEEEGWTKIRVTRAFLEVKAALT